LNAPSTGTSGTSTGGGGKVKKEGDTAGKGKTHGQQKDKSRMKQLLYSLKTDKAAPGLTFVSS
jgi:hypothetical protein